MMLETYVDESAPIFLTILYPILRIVNRRLGIRVLCTVVSYMSITRYMYTNLSRSIELIDRPPCVARSGPVVVHVPEDTRDSDER